MVLLECCFGLTGSILPLAGLEKLDLGCNRIRDCAAVNALPRLEELSLAMNELWDPSLVALSQVLMIDD